MSEGLPITSMGMAPANNAPAEPVEKVTSSPMDRAAIETLTAVQMSRMVSSNIESYVDNCLKAKNLPRTEENYNKIAINLSKKIETWLIEGDELMTDVDTKEYSKYFLDSACQRMGLPSTTENWKRVLQKLGKVQ